MPTISRQHFAAKADKCEEAEDSVLMGVTDVSIHHVLISLTFINFILITPLKLMSHFAN